MPVISLQKGQKVDLTKSHPAVTKVVVGLGWDTNKYEGAANFDLDASAFMVNSAGVVANDKDFIYYNNLKSADGSILHTGDNLTGDGDGDDEQIKVDLASIPEGIEKVAFAVTIYDAVARNQNFGQVSNAFVRVFDEATGEELIRYDLGEDFSVETAVIVGEFYRKDGEWKFSAIGSGYHDGLAGICKNFGLSV